MRITIECDIPLNHNNPQQTLFLKSIRYDFWQYILCNDTPQSEIAELQQGDIELVWNGQTIDITTEHIDTLISAFEKGYIHKQNTIYD